MKAMLLAAAAGLLALAGCAQQNGAGAPAATQQFTLRDQHGRPYTVARPGTAAALYFGFSHCKDVCPQTLRLLGRARSIAHLTAAQVPIVMVTVDPEHDTEKVLDAFVRRTGVDAEALTGKPSQLARIYRAYGVVVQPRKDDVLHTDSIYLIDRDAKLRRIVDPTDSPDVVAKALRSVVD